MRMRLAVAFIVAAVLAEAAGIVAEASFGALSLWRRLPSKVMRA